MGESGTEQAPTRLGFMSYMSQCSLIFYGPIILIWFIDNLFALTYHSKVIMSTGCGKMAPSSVNMAFTVPFGLSNELHHSHYIEGCDTAERKRLLLRNQNRRGYVVSGR